MLATSKVMWPHLQTNPLQLLLHSEVLPETEETLACDRLPAGSVLLSVASATPPTGFSWYSLFMKRLCGSSSRSTVYFFSYGLQQFVACKFSICFSAELMYIHQWSAILFGFSRRIKKIFCSNTKTFWCVFLVLRHEQRFGSLQSGWCLVQSAAALHVPLFSRWYGPFVVHFLWS